MMKYREGVYLKGRNNVCAEIISSDGNGQYTVQVRGSSAATSDEEDSRKTALYRYKIHKDDLTFVTSELGERHAVEQIRKHLFELHCSATNIEDKSIGKRVIGHLLGDECGFLIWKHTNRNTLDGLPNNIEERVLALVVEENYCLGGGSTIDGRGLTSYARILEPFVNVEEETVEGTCRALVKTSTPLTGEGIVLWFESLVLEKTPAHSASLFLRAFAFAQYCCDNRSADDSLLGAFYVLFSAIQMMTGKGSSENIRSCRLEIQEAIDASFQQHGSWCDTSDGKQNMQWKALLWCLCNLFLQIGFIVRDKFPEHQYQILLPNPYGDTISEQGKICNILIESRGGHPASYYAAYQMITDVKDLILPNELHLSNAFTVARRGKEVAFKQSDAFYSYLFLLIETFWIPTSLWPNAEAITYKDIEERFDQAKELKQICQDYTSEKSLDHASPYKNDLKTFLKSLGIVSVSEQGSMLVSSIQFDSYAYCSYRFGTTSYYKPGGKFDRLATRYTCSHCSKPLSILQRCARCKRENYCNRDCQTNHWKNGHKNECKPKRSIS